MDIFLLYLWTRLDALSFALTVVCILLALAMLVTFPVAADSGEKTAASARAYRKKFFIGLCFCVPAAVLVPTSNNALFIMGGSVVLDAARSEPAKRIASKSVQLIEETMDKYLNKTDPKK